MADTFPDIAPTYGSSPKNDFRVLEASFGDGYSQRAADGLNSSKITWSLTWEVRPVADITTINDFLVDKLGFEHFLWTSPTEVTERKWICKSINGPTPISAEASGYSTLSCEFEEVFDL